MRNGHGLPTSLLVVGFGAFQDNARNPSGEIAEALDGRQFHGVRIIGRQVPVAWRGTWEYVRDEVEALGPAGLLGLGIAPDPFIRLETLARNIARYEFDEVGEVFSAEPIAPIVLDAPDFFRSSLPLEWLESRFDRRREARIGGTPADGVMVAKLWHDAGHFLCNYLFYNAMLHFGGRLDACGFVHIPRLPRAGESKRPDEPEIFSSVEVLVESLARWLVAPDSSPDESIPVFGEADSVS